jgi:hypothetical protein
LGDFEEEIGSRKSSTVKLMGGSDFRRRKTRVGISLNFSPLVFWMNCDIFKHLTLLAPRNWLSVCEQSFLDLESEGNLQLSVHHQHQYGLCRGLAPEKLLKILLESRIWCSCASLTPRNNV